jgi:hypothetical protein
MIDMNNGHIFARDNKGWFTNSKTMTGIKK